MVSPQVLLLDKTIATARRLFNLGHIPSDLFCQVSGILTDARQERRLRLVQILQAQEIHAWHIGHTTPVDRLAIRRENRQINPIEAITISCRPDYAADPG